VLTPSVVVLLTESMPLSSFLCSNQLEASYLYSNNKTCRKRENQRNHRIPKKIHNIWQPCSCFLDCIRHCSFPANQSGGWRGFSLGCAHCNLWCAKVSRLPATMLQLQKMHLWLGQISSIVLWETQPQRLQI
jgi:hypothetical protein